MAPVSRGFLLVLFALASFVVFNQAGKPGLTTCVEGNYTEKAMGNVLYNLTVNGTDVWALVLVRPANYSKVNWTIGNGTMTDASHFSMKFPYWNGWVDSLTATASKDCTNITWSNNALWVKVPPHFEGATVDRVHIVDFTRLDCSLDVGMQISNGVPLVCTNHTSATNLLVPLIAKTQIPILHVQYSDMDCQPSNFPSIFRWRHRQSGYEATVVLSSTIERPAQVVSESRDVFVAATSLNGHRSLSSLHQAAETYYPTAVRKTMTMAEFAEKLNREASSMAEFFGDTLPFSC